jgi:hypothetical protein
MLVYIFGQNKKNKNKLINLNKKNNYFIFKPLLKALGSMLGYTPSCFICYFYVVFLSGVFENCISWGRLC